MALRPTGRVLVELRHTVQHRFAKGMADIFVRPAGVTRPSWPVTLRMISGIVALGHANRGRNDYRPAYTLISLLQTRLNPQSPKPAMIRIAFGGPTCSERMPIITTPVDQLVAARYLGDQHR